MAIAISKLTAASVKALPYTLTSRYDMCDPAHSRAVIEVGEDYLVGRFEGWQGLYWCLEKGITIMFYSNSVKDIRERVQLGRQVAKEV